MEEALRKIEAALKERQKASRIGGLMPAPAVRPQDQAGGLGIEHYGKVNMVVEGGGQPAEAPRAEPPPAHQDAGSRIAAGSKELSLDELSEQQPPQGDALKTKQLGGSRFHELSLDDLSAPVGNDTEKS